VIRGVVNSTMVSLWILLIAFACASFGQAPDCSKPFVITDPFTKRVYSYDLSQAAQTTVAGLIGGAETGQTWTIYLNICGNTGLPGGPAKCATATPVCQVDGANSYNCGGGGNPSNWLVKPYYEPADPTTLLYDGGVVVVAGGGDSCVQGTVTRTTTLFLKCDPNVLELPALGNNTCFSSPSSCLGITEASVCQYSFAPIPWAGFCPGYQPTPPPANATQVSLVERAKICFSSGSNGTTTAVISKDYSDFINFNGWTCEKVSQRICNDVGLYLCGGPTPAGFCTQCKGLYSLELSGWIPCGPVTGSFLANDYYATTCLPANSAFLTLISTPPSQFASSNGTIVLKNNCRAKLAVIPIVTVEPGNFVCGTC